MRKNIKLIPLFLFLFVFQLSRSARCAAAICDPFSSVPFGSHDLLGTEENGSFRRPVAALETE